MSTGGAPGRRRTIAFGPGVSRALPAPGRQALDEIGLRREIGLVRGGEGGHARVGAVEDVEQPADRRRGETAVDDMIDQGPEFSPIAGDVDQDDRLVVQPKLLPGDDLEGLLDRADSAGQYGEGVGALEHQVLALVHAADDDQLADAVMADLAVVKMRRDDPGDAAAAEPGSVGEAAHEADPAATIDELDAGFGKPGAEIAGGLAICRIDPVGCTAIDAQAPHRSHVLLPVVAGRVVNRAGRYWDLAYQSILSFRRSRAN